MESSVFLTKAAPTSLTALGQSPLTLTLTLTHVSSLGAGSSPPPGVEVETSVC